VQLSFGAHIHGELRVKKGKRKVWWEIRTGGPARNEARQKSFETWIPGVKPGAVERQQILLRIESQRNYGYTIPDRKNISILENVGGQNWG